LGTELDAQFPFWQRSLDLVVLTSPKSDHITGLQDIVSRYQIGEVVDAGMLHPNTGYALWRRTISDRNIAYTQVRQGTTIALGSQVALQVFWPSPSLHKGTNEDLENGLIVRLVAPGLRMLLLGATALDQYALNGLLSSISPQYLQADIVQIDDEVGKTFPTELSAVLQFAHPSLLVISPSALSAKDKKAGVSSILTSLPSVLISTVWQTMQTAQMGTIEVNSNGQGWGMNVV